MRLREVLGGDAAETESLEPSVGRSRPYEPPRGICAPCAGAPALPVEPL